MRHGAHLGIFWALAGRFETFCLLIAMCQPGLSPHDQRMAGGGKRHGQRARTETTAPRTASLEPQSDAPEKYG